jgi:hypothetical protein
MSKPKVYILNRGCHDFSRAEPYGEFIYMTEGYLSMFSVTTLWRMCCKLFAESSPLDYIVASGPIPLAMVAAAAFAIRHKRLNLLIFDPKTKDYFSREMLLVEKEEGENGK